MLNVMKMDLYRLIRSKSFYVILIIVAAFMVLNIYMLKYGTETVNDQTQSETISNDGIETVDLGITYDNASLLKDHVNLLDEVSVTVSSAVMLMFTGIFTVIFTCGEYGSGFIKNIVSCTKSRQYIILSKTVALAAFVFCEMIIMLIMTGIVSSIILDNFSMDLSLKLFQYIGLQYLLHIAFAVIIVMVSVVLRNTAISIIISICLCSGFGTLIISFLSNIKIAGAKIGANLPDYLITTNVSLLKSNFTTNNGMRVILVSVIAILMYNLITCIVMEKRDI